MTKAKNSIARAVGQKIQVLRKDHGISAARLAEMIEISQQQMSRYERGVNRVVVDCLVRIADIFEVPVGWFFTEIECRSKRDSGKERESWKAETVILPVESELM